MKITGKSNIGSHVYLVDSMGRKIVGVGVLSFNIKTKEAELILRSGTKKIATSKDRKGNHRTAVVKVKLPGCKLVFKD